VFSPEVNRMFTVNAPSDCCREFIEVNFAYSLVLTKEQAHGPKDGVGEIPEDVTVTWRSGYAKGRTKRAVRLPNTSHL
jgi:hypothetical protein